MHIKNVQLWYIVDFNFIDKTNETLRQYMNWIGWGSFFTLFHFLLHFWLFQDTKKVEKPHLIFDPNRSLSFIEKNYSLKEKKINISITLKPLLKLEARA